MAWGFQVGESEFVCINNAFCLYETFPVQKKVSHLHILQLFFSVLLGVIADIGVLQGCFVTARNYSSVVRCVRRKTVAGIFSLLGAVARSLSGVTQITFETVARVLLGFLRGVGIVEISFVTTGLTSIGHFLEIVITKFERVC